jgi:hypothetical protein
VLDPSSEASCSEEIIDIILSLLFSSRLLVEEAEEEEGGKEGGREGGRGSYMCKKSLTKSLGFFNFQICSFLVKISSSLA